MRMNRRLICMFFVMYLLQLIDHYLTISLAIIHVLKEYRIL